MIENPNSAPVGGIPSAFVQIFPCYLQLMIIVGLCMDSKKSWTGKFFKTKIMKFFGRISLSLYLVHGILIDWLKFISYGPQVDRWKNPEFNMPIWEIPIHLVLSLILATIITIFIEEPAQKCLENVLTKRKDEDQVASKCKL